MGFALNRIAERWSLQAELSNAALTLSALFITAVHITTTIKFIQYDNYSAHEL
jgi:hypothetical protein